MEQALQPSEGCCAAPSYASLPFRPCHLFPLSCNRAANSRGSSRLISPAARRSYWEICLPFVSSRDGSCGNASANHPVDRQRNQRFVIAQQQSVRSSLLAAQTPEFARRQFRLLGTDNRAGELGDGSWPRRWRCECERGRPALPPSVPWREKFSR